MSLLAHYEKRYASWAACDDVWLGRYCTWRRWFHVPSYLRPSSRLGSGICVHVAAESLCAWRQYSAKSRCRCYGRTLKSTGCPARFRCLDRSVGARANSQRSSTCFCKRQSASVSGSHLTTFTTQDLSLSHFITLHYITRSWHSSYWEWPKV